MSQNRHTAVSFALAAQYSQSNSVHKELAEAGCRSSSFVLVLAYDPKSPLQTTEHLLSIDFNVINPFALDSFTLAH